ncbi:MAG TPA: Sua5/YciO/YrdC/YwlC family protein [Prolixibacteraceae bacterium]|nr:Sua5/YciO/YrdC/YwlC family protein [Prolixibacteraceae bacterium]
MINDIKAAIEVLQKGGIILYPTDTAWSLGCDAANEQAVKCIHEIKKSDRSKDLIVLMENAALLERFLNEVPEIAYDLIELTDKPLTIIFDGAKNMANNLIAEDGSIGIRITTDAFSSELIRRFKRPIVCTPASINGKPSPFNFDAIAQEIVDAADYVVNFRQDETQKAVEPGVMKLGRGGEVKIIKP